MKHLKKILSIVLVAAMLVIPFVTVASAAKVGDITGDGKINKFDYFYLKRYCLQTVTLDSAQLKAADIDGNGKVNKFDYILLKRYLLGTYTIKDFKMEEVGDAVEFDENISYQKYNVTGSENGNTESVVTLEFNPADGYIPMAFSGNAASVALLADQYDIATNKYGYEVKGIINGAFFSTANGFLNGMLVSNGKLVMTHAGLQENVVCFGSDGTMKTVDSKLQIDLYVNTQKVNDAIYAINKTMGAQEASAWDDRLYYYDTSCGMTVDTFEECPGYEVICEKLGELIIGGTMLGDVIEVRENSYGAAIADSEYDMSDKFVLFVKKDSPYAKFVKDLDAGDYVDFIIEETIEESRETMENANSVISNLGPFNGWLVKDGVDLTETNSTIGSHSVTTAARWTAFGIKEDGTYVFMTSEGGSTGQEGRSLTLCDVASIMIEKGCVDVIRMDGGGSSAMYVSDAGDGNPGYLQPSTRPVADCILVVKADSVQNDDITENLYQMTLSAESYLESYSDPSVIAALAEAQALLEQDIINSGDAMRETVQLEDALAQRDKLKEVMDTVTTLSIGDYSEENLDLIRQCYSTALYSYFGAGLDPDEIDDFVAYFNELVETAGEGTLVNNAVFVTNFNASILGGNTNIFTPDFGTISDTTANIKWTHNMILTWDDTEGAYVVSEVFLGNGFVSAADAKESIVLEENQILIANHNDEVTESLIKNAANFDAAQVGDVLVLHAIDIDAQEIGLLAYITFE